MRSEDRRPDRVGAVIAALAGVSSIGLAHLAMPELSVGLLIVPGSIVGAGIAIAVRRPRRNQSVDRPRP